MNILKEADAIMNDRAQEKERQYGNFVDSMYSASIIATELTGIEISPENFCKCMIALKLGRMRYNVKDDTLVDAVAYIDGLKKILDASKQLDTIVKLQNAVKEAENGK